MTNQAAGANILYPLNEEERLAARDRAAEIVVQNVATVIVGGEPYQLAAMPSPDGGYWAAYRPDSQERWETDGEPHKKPETAIEAAARAAEVDRIARSCLVWLSRL